MKKESALKILPILLIVGLGVQTFISCTDFKEIEFYSDEEKARLFGLSSSGEASSSSNSSSSALEQEASSSSSDETSDSSSSSVEEQGESSSSGETSSSSSADEQDSSSSEETSSSSVVSSSSSASTVPEPINVGQPLSFTNISHTDANGKYYYLNVTPQVVKNWVIGNPTESKCGDVAYVEELNTSTPGTVRVIARAYCNDAIRELDRIEATVIPNPSLSCEWSEPVLIPEKIEEEVALFSVKNNYERCEDAFLSLDGVNTWIPPVAWQADAANITNLKIYANCGDSFIEKSCPIKIKNPKATGYIVDNGTGRDGQAYQIVRIQIGEYDKIWMAENLNYSDNGTKGRCYGADNSSVNNENCAKYGRLYDWATAMNLPSNCNNSTCSGQVQAEHRGICPNGWHLPSNAEWDDLINYVENEADCSYCAGTYLKASGDKWKAHNDIDNLDTYGFSALPGGYSYSNSSLHDDIGNRTSWWSASEFNASNAYYRYMHYNYKSADEGYTSKPYLYSIRCVKDVTP